MTGDTRQPFEYKYVKKGDFPAIRAIRPHHVKLLKLWASIPRGEPVSPYEIAEQLGLKGDRAGYAAGEWLEKNGMVSVPLRNNGQRLWDGMRITNKGRRMIGYAKFFEGVA